MQLRVMRQEVLGGNVRVRGGLRFQLSQEAFGLRQHRFRQAGQGGDLDAVALVGRAFLDGMHEDDLVRVLDGERKPVFSDAQRFTADNVSRSTVSSFQINRYLQQPGQWQVEVYLDNERFAQKGVKVLPAAN